MPVKEFYIPFVLTVSGILLYHISQKAIPKSLSPVYAITIAYVVGIFVCVLAAFMYWKDESLPSTLRGSNWAVYTLGISIAVIEVGFLLAYRAGWNISLTAAASTVAVTILLVPIGLLVYGEHLSLRDFIGLAFCIVGLILVAHK